MRRVLLWSVVALVLVAILPPVGRAIFGWGPDESVRAPEGKSVAIGGGLEINLIDVGEGPPVFLVHGLPSCAGDWAGTVAELAAAGHRVIAYDRIGYGYSSRSEATLDRYTYDSNAHDLLALMDALDIERAALVGWSYGGGVVQLVAQVAPERVSHLVLIGAVGPTLAAEEPEPLDVIVASPLGSAILSWVASVPPLSRITTHGSLVQAFAREDAIPEGWTEYTRAMLGMPGVLRTFALEMRRNNLSGFRPEEIAVPALVLHGSDDYLVPLSVGEALDRRLPNSTLSVVPEGSHMLPITHPKLVAEQIHLLTQR